MTPFEALKAEVETLSARVERVEAQQTDPLLPGYLARLAADYQILADICAERHVSPHLPRHRSFIARELRRRGWSVPRMARVLCIGQDKIRAHLKKSPGQKGSAEGL